MCCRPASLYIASLHFVLTLVAVPFSIRFSDPPATPSVALQVVMAKVTVSRFRRRYSVWRHRDGFGATCIYRLFALNLGHVNRVHCCLKSLLIGKNGHYIV